MADPQGRGGGSRVGHLRYWNNKIKDYNIEIKETDSDKLVKSRSWVRNFEVLDFETTRNEATDHWKTWTCYTDGSKLGNHTGYGYLINRFGRTMHEGYDHMGPRASVFMAKIRAITTVAHTLMQRKGQNILIRSDSQVAIKAISITTSLCSEPTGMEFSLQLVYVVSQPGWNFQYHHRQ
jgi:hypothetical protein